MTDPEKTRIVNPSVTRAVIGRPRVHHPAEVMTSVCAIIADGHSVGDACKELRIHRSQVHVWALKPEFSDMYAYARQLQAHALAERCIELAQSATPDDWQVKRLEIDTLKWYTSKIAPRLYGEKIQVEHSAIDYNSLSDEELRLIAAGKTPQRLLVDGKHPGS